MKVDLEKIVLGIFLLATLYLGPGILFNHSISHEFPYAYGASDAFQHQIRAEAIKDAGNFKYEATYISKGVENAIGRYPPVLYHIGVVFANATGLKVYDAIYFIVTFFTVMGALLFYFVIKLFNKTVAILSLPLMMLAFSFPPSLGFIWGHWPSILSQVFLILVFYTIARLDLKHSYILVGIAMAATALTHTSETIFAVLFVGMYYLVKLVTRKITKDDFVKMGISIGLFLVICSYFLIIFMNTWAKTQPYVFKVDPIWNGNPGFYFAGFGLSLIFIVLGIIISLTKIKQNHIALIAGLAMLIAGFMNYVGFELRSFQIRFFWPIYLSVFMGLGIYILFKFIIKKWNFISTSAVFVVLLILFSGTVSYPVIANTKAIQVPAMLSLSKETSAGIMNPYHWEGFNWLAERTPENASVYFFFGSIYSQDSVLRNSKRYHAQADPQEFANALSSNEIKRMYVSELPGDGGGSIAVREGLFEFRDTHPDNPKEFYFGPKDICNFDYWVVDKQPGDHPLIQYNLLIANELAQEGAEPLFDNGVVVIIKNNNVGGDCIEEKPIRSE